ncbi:MAG: preprotein translocase subunit SecE [Clostridia bacterium]|nr:preprotein translocase subunit SecE [Clostridia bacterium]
MAKMAKEKAKEKKPGLGRRIKDVFSELKRVNWPSFGKVVKATCVVLVVTLVFLVIATGINVGLQKLLELITQVKN